MSPKVLITGGTGYIGGSVLHTIATTHPEYNITALLRTPPQNFNTVYPNVTVVQGTYDSTDILTSEAAKADIVIHNGSSDHEASLKALIAGLVRKYEDTGEKGYLLHLSGTGIVSDWAKPTYLGRLNPKIWSDMSLSDISTIQSLPKTELHRNTEIILHDTIKDKGDKVNVAIMCPPDIYGRGKGIGKKTSALVPVYIKVIQDTGGKAFYHGEGTNTRSWVHINDLMRLYTHVVEAAASKSENHFNTNGYYFASTQEWSQRDLAIATGRILKERGVVSDARPVQVGLDVLDAMENPYPTFPLLGRYLFASNSRTRAERAKEVFGFEGREVGLLEALEGDIVDVLGS